MSPVGIIIQARMGSSRLPGKVLKLIGSTSLLGHVIGRLKSLGQSWPIVVATSNLTQDGPIAQWCKKEGVEVFRGSEQDVLKRYLDCALYHGFANIVRLTADNPFTDIVELKKLIELHLNQQNAYTHSFGMMPLGVGAEIMSLAALKQSELEGLEPHHREHVNEYIQEHPKIFQTGVLEVPTTKRDPTLRLTVDTKEDWQRAVDLVQRSSTPWLGTEEAIALCSQSA